MMRCQGIWRWRLLAWAGLSAAALSPWRAPAEPGQAATRPAASQPGPPEASTINPHWSLAGCAECHPDADQEIQPLSIRQVERICYRCHDGRLARREAHPVGRGFTNPQVAAPEGWPLREGKLTCLTCHEFTRRHEVLDQRPRDNPAFLRGNEGENLLTFCARCHVVPEAHAPHNPHRMTDPRGRIVEQNCLFCHEPAIMDHNRHARTGRPLLRLNEKILCMSCHFQHLEYFEPGHVGAVVSAAMKSRMIRRQTMVLERTGWSLAGAEGTPADGPETLLPLTKGTEGEFVTCATCHNPHEQGVFPPDSILANGALAPAGERGRQAYRGFGKELCLGCHE